MMQVSHSCGRADALFPYLPYALRCRLRIDAVGAFSMADQDTGDTMVDLVAFVAAACHNLLLPPRPAVAPPDNAAEGEEEAGQLEQEAQASVKAKRDGQAAAGEARERINQSNMTAPSSESAANNATPPQRQPPPLLPSVPVLLPLHATDATACCGGSAIALARRFGRVTAVELDGDRADDLQHNVTLLGWPARRATEAELVAAGSSGSTEGKSREAAARQAGATAGAGSAAEAVPAATASSATVTVVCAPYEAVAAALHQDVVLLDPPWGGPGYVGSRSSPFAAAAQADSLVLGSVRVTTLCAQLLHAGVIVAARLPFAMAMTSTAFCDRVLDQLNELKAAAAAAVAACGATSSSAGSGSTADSGGEHDRNRPAALIVRAPIGRSGLLVMADDGRFGSKWPAIRAAVRAWAASHHINVSLYPPPAATATVAGSGK